MKILGEILIGISIILILFIFGLYLFIVLSYYLKVFNRHITPEYSNPQSARIMKILKKWGWGLFAALLLFVLGVFVRGGG